MRFQIRTLVDITETNARFDKNDPAWHQQQNFITVIQTLGLRCNLSYEKPVWQESISLKEQGFGSGFRGEHTVWFFEFTPDFDGIMDEQTVTEDLDLIPIIAGLDETVKLKKPMFETQDPKSRNTLVICID